MLPNRFPDVGETPEYNTVDATLWFFVAAYKYYLYTQDQAFLKEILLPAMAEMLDWHQRGTRYGIHMESDGLLAAGEPGVQLTWMDVKIGDWVVTPRSGKAVEINALWYNAVAIYAQLLHTVGRKEEAKTGRKKGLELMPAVRDHLSESGIGQISEVFDGDAPHAPRGCIAQAWSVAEILRAYVENIRMSLAFQREVINNIIPRVAPDLIHCNDWMTGLIPATARQMMIPSLFSIHNIHTMEILLSEIEDRGIDPTGFWRQLYFSRMPVDYDESRLTNPVDLLVSGSSGILSGFTVPEDCFGRFSRQWPFTMCRPMPDPGRSTESWPRVPKPSITR